MTADVDQALVAVAEYPVIGERERGDLAALIVFKFRSPSQRDWLGYTVADGVRLVYLEAIGPHENVYRDLKH